MIPTRILSMSADTAAVLSMWRPIDRSALMVTVVGIAGYAWTVTKERRKTKTDLRLASSTRATSLLPLSRRFGSVKKVIGNTLVSFP